MADCSGADARIGFRLRGRIVAEDFQHFARVLQRTRDARNRAGLGLQIRQLFHDALGCVGIAPETLGSRTLL